MQWVDEDYAGLARVVWMDEQFDAVLKREEDGS
jgi:hypothetical protein